MTTRPPEARRGAPPVLLFALVGLLFVLTGMFQSWNVSLTVLNMALVSAVMALGVNMQWGYAGLFNIGIMGFTALGGLAAVLVAMPPVPEAWSAGGPQLIFGLLIGAATVVVALQVWKRLPPGWLRTGVFLGVLVVGFVLYRGVFDPARTAVEAVNPAATGYLGGLGLPVILSWPVGGVFAAGAAWLIGKTALGLRSDYLAIATLGISEIVIAILKNEDWLARGVKNVIGIPRPVPQEVALQSDPDFVARAAGFGVDAATASSITVKLMYAGLFAAALAILLVLAQLALKSPWGRMMRAIRDNEVAAEAMGKDVKGRHLQIFVLGSAICGIAGAMMVTLFGQLTPGSYIPLQYTFLIWVMVIVGGSGNNYGAILGGFLIYWLWAMGETLGANAMSALTAMMPPDSPLTTRLQDGAAYMRLISMGAILLFVLRFSPRGLIPEK